MSDPVHVFLYDPAAQGDIESQPVRVDSVQGTLFDVEGVGPALMLAGTGRVSGEVRRVAPEALPRMDERARVGDRVYRRVGVEIGNTPCWTWVAGPVLAQRIGASRHGSSGSI